MNIETNLLMMNRFRLTIILIVLGATFAPSAQARELLDPTRPNGYTGITRSGLQATLVADGHRIAIISGRRYRVGDRYRGALIKQIKSYEVVMNRQGKIVRLRLVPRVKK